MKNNGIILQYTGVLNYHVLNNLLQELKNYVQQHNLEVYYHKKIQIVMVEMLENNYQYALKLSETGFVNDDLASFKIEKNVNGFKLISSNLVKKEDADFLREHINKINNLSRKQLSDLYKTILIEGMYSKKETAGIGLIRIAKVIKNKMKYSFRQIDNNSLYYSLEIIINSK